MAIHCDLCKNPAVWRITAQTSGFENKKGGAQMNKYGCDNHKENLADSLELEISQDEKESGQPSGYGLVKIIPLIIKEP